MAQGVGDRFQRETKYHRDRMPGGGPGRLSQPELYKAYRQATQIELPNPEVRAAEPLHELLLNRRSVRQFTDAPLSLDHLSYLLWAADGIQRREAGYELRTAPSAGALYPIETYVVANRAEGVPAGVYHYAVRTHCLEQIGQGDFASEVAAAALGQRMCLAAAAVFVWSAVFPRSKWKYRQRAYRYVYLDAGHIAENLALAAVALGLGTCQVGALYDDEVNDILGLDGTKESVIYITVVGVPAETKQE